MPYKFYTDYEFSREVLVEGNNLDILLWEYKLRAAQKAFEAKELKSKAINNLDDLVYPGSIYNSPAHVRQNICKISTESKILGKVVKEIEAAIEKDFTSELRITYSD